MFPQQPPAAGARSALEAVTSHCFCAEQAAAELALDWSSAICAAVASVATDAVT